MTPRFLILFITGLNLLVSNTPTNWTVEKGTNSDNGRIFSLLSNKSTNEERITSERVRGELKIYCDGKGLRLIINWGEFANLGMGNVYYYMNNYGLWEQDWRMSNNGEISYAPDPLLLLMQLITTDSLAIGIKPKYSNEIRYYFNNNGLSDILKANQNIFGDYSQLIIEIFNDKNLPDKYKLRSMLSNYISKEADLRSLRVSLFDNDRFFFRPIWYKSKLNASHHTDSGDDKIIYYNRWLKKKGTLFTEKDVRVAHMFTKKPKIIAYQDINHVEVKGNTITGYRIHINNRYITRFHKTDKDKIEQIRRFIINRSAQYNSG